MARSTAKTSAQVIALGGDVPTEGANDIIAFEEPYVVSLRIQGTADYIFHAWNVESVEAKSKAAKGSKAKKTDDIESYVYRDDNGNLAIPGTQLRAAIVAAARYKQDPRSPRKSAMDLYKAGIILLNNFASLGTKAWHYEHKCRMVVNRAAITRVRPAMRVGWDVAFDIEVLLPEYISHNDLHDVITKAGKFCGLGDSRPTYGRFQIVHFAVR